MSSAVQHSVRMCMPEIAHHLDRWEFHENVKILRYSSKLIAPWRHSAMIVTLFASYRLNHSSICDWDFLMTHSSSRLEQNFQRTADVKAAASSSFTLLSGSLFPSTFQEVLWERWIIRNRTAIYVRAYALLEQVLWESRRLIASASYSWAYIATDCSWVGIHQKFIYGRGGIATE